MAYLVVGGVTVKVAIRDGARAETVEVGDRARAFDGTMLSSVRGRKQTWVVETVLLTKTDRDALVTALDGTPPVTVSGDLLNGVTSAVPQRTTEVVHTLADGTRRYVVGFNLHEA